MLGTELKPQKFLKSLLKAKILTKSTKVGILNLCPVHKDYQKTIAFQNYKTL